MLREWDCDEVLTVALPVVGKSQSQLGFKSRFQPFCWFDL